jgi:hypothetical protein
VSASNQDFEPAPRRRAVLASVVVLAAAAYVSAIAGWIIHDLWAGRAARQLTALPDAPHVPLGSNALAYRIAGSDSTGNRATFEIILARAPVQWAAGSADRLARADTILPGRALGGLATAEIRDRLSAATHLVALGIAGDEGAPTDALYLAGQRARQTALWLSQIVPGGTPIDMLNLGRTVDPCATCTTVHVSWERPIAVAAVVASVRGTDLAEALAAALASTRNVPGPARFSAFALTRLRRAGDGVTLGH